MAEGIVIYRYAFLLWRKLLHELACKVLYLRVLQNYDDHKTPPGLFCCAAGITLENLMSGGVFTHRGIGMKVCKFFYIHFTFYFHGSKSFLLQCSEVLVQPVFHPLFLKVPDEWMKAFFKQDLTQSKLKL
jgi:hypothetical protein